MTASTTHPGSDSSDHDHAAEHARETGSSNPGPETVDIDPDIAVEPLEHEEGSSNPGPPTEDVD